MKLNHYNSILVILLHFSIGCEPVVFENTLVTKDTITADSSLTGIWEFYDDYDEQAGYVLIGEIDSARYTFLSFYYGESGLLGTELLYFFQIATINDIRTVSLSTGKDDDEYQFYTYKMLNDSVINIYSQDDEYLIQQVKQRNVNGYIERDTSDFLGTPSISESAIITSSSKELIDFFSEAKHDSAFYYFGKMIRIYEPFRRRPE